MSTEDDYYTGQPAEPRTAPIDAEPEAEPSICLKHPSSRMVHFDSCAVECWTCLNIDGNNEL